MQQGGGPQTDGRTEDALRPHEQGAHGGDDPIRGTQVGSALAATIEDQQLMAEQYRFGHDGAEPAWSANRARVTIR